MSLYDLTGNKVSFTYGRLVQIASGSYYDGFGNLLNLSGSGTILTTGSTYPITSSWANNVISSSYALTASYALNGGGSINLVTGSTYPITSSWAIHSINVDGGYVTASGILTAGDIIPSNPSASLGTTQYPFKEIKISSGSISIANADPLIEAVILSNVNGNLDVSSGGIRLVQQNSSFIAPTGSFSYLSSSFKQVGDRLLIGNDIISGSLQVVNGITGSLYGTSSWAITASYCLNSSGQTASEAVSASFYSSSVWEFTHSLSSKPILIQAYDVNFNQIIPQNILLVNLDVARITFPISASGYAIASKSGILMISSSAGTSLVTGSTYQITSSWANNVVSASYSNNSTSASYSLTASYWSGSIVSSSYALTASYALNGGGGGGTTLITGSTYSITSSWSNNSISSSVSISSSYTVTASYSSNSLTASYFGSGSDNYFPFWSSNKLSYNSLISQSNNQIAILSDTTSFLGDALIINKSDPIYVNNNPTIDASNSPNQTLMLTPNVVIGGDGNSEHWNRFNSNGTVDFLGANIKFTSGGAAAFNSSITIGSPVLLGNNVLDVIGNISASAITASRLVGTADSASYLTPTNNYTVANLTSSNILVTGTIYASNFSASTIYITSSEYIVSDNIITLNALNPYRRYAGLELHDSGSSNFSSILWDSQNNYLFVSSSETVGSRQIILGPDNQVNLISNYIPLISGSNTITSSIIYQNTGNIGIGTTLPSAKVDVVGDVQANAFYGKSFNLTTTSGQSAIFDTFTSTGTGEVYEITIKGNPNAGESNNYQDVIYGKIIVGTGKTGSIATTFVNYVQESPDPRLLYSSGGSSLTASVYFNSASVDVTQKGVGQSTPIRVVIGSYAVGYVGNNTTVRLKQIL